MNRVNKGKRATRGQDEQRKKGKKGNRVSLVVGTKGGRKHSLHFQAALVIFFLPLLRKKKRRKNAFSTFLYFFMGWLLRKCGNMCPGVVATRDTVCVR